MTFPTDMESIRKSLDTSQIKGWRSIVTLMVFIITNINALFPFHVPFFVPRVIPLAITKTLVALHIISPSNSIKRGHGNGVLVRYNFPMNFVTAPLIANLFLLAAQAIGRTEVHDGIIGANNIAPYDIMLFFLSLAYIALSIDASGLIRYLAYRVLKSGGNAGYRLYLSLYCFFFALTAAIGNDPVILSGTPFLAYLTRVSANISQPLAWIYAQFAVANIASAILVSSNPTNLVFAGAFGIRFISYSANIIVPVIVTGVVLFPCLLFIIFRNDSLIPRRIEMHQLSEEQAEKAPINPNIPVARTDSGTGTREPEQNVLPLEEIMNPYLDKIGATVAAFILAITLVTLIVVNAVISDGQTVHAFWVTSPAAIVTLAFDLAWGYKNRHESRRVANERRAEPERVWSDTDSNTRANPNTVVASGPIVPVGGSSGLNEKPTQGENTNSQLSLRLPPPVLLKQPTLMTRISARYTSFRIDFPTASTALASLPFALVPFAFCMFILVQALVTKGWVPVFAHGWDAWVRRTGTVGAVGGMGFLSVILSNFAGTNIGAAILLSRIIQAWQDIHTVAGTAISNRTFWGTVYSAVIGVNYGAFSIAFSASLAGLLWRSILEQKLIHVRSRDFLRVNLPIITITMVVSCSVLTGQIYIVRGTTAYNK
ncbi:hypothetical protein P154DRAFT_591631 [Amniculicola lignicola CBS 123094]|uniref:Citrate transporter-like domain-containing protein n=1 Tax=Amniculicola lignicola CBS 123094 TaxID=1392246 RepID=A0A6A5W1I4_9PLEO|nr:hypothetical protein P154DRAFT_591631 [Amniculicola lignicola CBS 123094]